MDKDFSRAAFEYYLRNIDQKRAGGKLDEKSVRQYLFDIANISDGLNDEGQIDYDLYTLENSEIAKKLRSDLLEMQFKISHVNLKRHRSYSAALTHFVRYLEYGPGNLKTAMDSSDFVPLQFAKERAIETVKKLSEKLGDDVNTAELLGENSRDEKELVELYRKLTESNKKFAFKVIAALSKN